jgi:Zn-dependent peptidase ImmA (M78 family)
MAKVLGQSGKFFLRDSPPELQFGVLQYRAKAGVSRRKLQALYRHAQLVLELALGLSARVKTIKVRIRPHKGGAIAAAQGMRGEFGLGSSEPVSHLIRAFEKAGGIILALPASNEVDAFAVWAKELPVIALSEQAEGDRMRLTVAHELGHLMMHRARASSAESEDEAYAFAAELMMPSKAILVDFDSAGVALNGLAHLKRKWGVSMQALARRARELGVVSDRQYHYLMQQLSARGWRLKEPSNLRVEPEKPRLLRRMAELLYGDPIDYSALAKDYCLKAHFATDVLRRYASAAEVGSRQNNGKVISFQRA